MSAEWYKEQLENRNHLAPVGFKLDLELFPAVDFFCQTANLPDITVPSTEVPTRFRSFDIIAGGGVSYGDFTVSFIIDEQLTNYKSIHNWIRANGASEEHMPTLDPQYSGGRLMILTSHFNVNHIIDFENLFPVSLTQLDFDATATDVDYITATVTFKFTNFTIRDQNFKV